MSVSLAPDAESNISCYWDQPPRTVCGNEPFFKEHNGRRYCVLHYPGKEKSLEFLQALHRKLRNNDFDFQGVWFPDDVNLRREFKTKANFHQATFAGSVYFSSAVFKSEAIFWDATFRDFANFNSAEFESSVDFTRAVFKEHANFGAMIFKKDARFLGVQFRSADFSNSKFDDWADFCSAASEGIAYFHRAEFANAANFGGTRLGAANFNEVSFGGEANFGSCEFIAKAEFVLAKFKGTADFQVSTFRENAEFIMCQFRSAANFNKTTFLSDANFSNCHFSDSAFFGTASFGRDTLFCEAVFEHDATFTDCILRDRLRFAGGSRESMFKNSSALDLQFATIDNPAHVSFHTVKLRPHCFANVDPRLFDLMYVDWELHSLRDEVKSLRERNISSLKVLSIACRQLSVNSEENQRYELASKFRYMAMEARRRTQWYGCAFWRLNWWYWLASGYGERVLRAFIVLISIMVISAGAFTRSGFARWEPKLASEAEFANAKRDEVGAPLPFKRALTYSLAVMTLQKPEPRPATPIAQSIVLLETILGPLQAALLALAIRRKFMR